MKNYLHAFCFATFVFVVAMASSFAGTPEQDPVVNKLMNDFERSHVPTLSELRLGKTWVCVTHMAERGNFETSGPTRLLNLSEFDGVIRNALSPPARVNDLVFDEYGLNGPGLGSTANYRVYVRISNSGDLIAEFTYPRLLPRLVPSISKRDRGAVSYTICPKSQIL